MRNFILLTFLLFLFSCSTQSFIKVRTSPDNAQISVRTNDGNVKVLGKGSVEMNTQQFFSLGSRMAKLEVSKENYKTQSVFIIQGKSSESYEVFITLDKELEDAKSSEMRSRLEKLSKTLTRATSAIHSKKYSEAEIMLNNLVSDFPSVSVVYDLLGNVYYLQKNMKEALRFYQRSYQINPENVETKNIIDRLSRMTDWGGP